MITTGNASEPDKPSKPHTVWVFIGNTVITIVIFTIGYFWQVKPQIDVAQKNLLLLTPSEVNVINRSSIDLERHRHDLLVANLGTDTVTNVQLRIGLFLVTDSGIYTCRGLVDEGEAVFADAERTARERIWPRLTLPPDSQIDFNDRVYSTATRLYTGVNTVIPSGEDETNHDLFAISRAFGGQYVMPVELSYRRTTDFVFHCDTSYFWYSNLMGPHQEVSRSVGGVGVIGRLTDYLAYGPELRITVKESEYVARRINLTNVYDEWEVVATRERHYEAKETTAQN